ncbi:AFG1 family mitochondrial ATPase [Coprinopsis cinerea okayama7|uniref:AFG1 family mitochondrial ATPase n=1 Tax=Coprinopsis cinerea (strain Okayama-7 / 130 / ATCC MYA-4618 / FGSC 9003) TaxID=240176 RepID=A8NYF6_COPC7|nr:AFG1 family mitochondrial ATPase [Coprinopsis cinerea okayama7\|eukprot:XP_001837415.2 AFG1 family mitochondrial ATPase [Coprinopsis cinerea okayama7\
MKAVRRVSATARIAQANRPQPQSIAPRATLSTNATARTPAKQSIGKAYNSSLANVKPSTQEVPFFQEPNRPSPSQTPQPSKQNTTQDGKLFRGNYVLTPLRQYQNLVSSGVLRGDEHQTRIIERLQELHDQLVTYEPPPLEEEVRANSFLSRWFSRETSEPVSSPANAPKGLYLYGDVGTGKTMLMDLFYKTLPPSIKRKRRVHFHAFMIDVHKRVHAAKIAMGFDGGDPIIPVARDLAREAYVLCFDEFQVTDIADAMILRRLLENLLNYGVIMVMTSNRHPNDLYKNGIQRASFLPAIDLLNTQLRVTDLDSGTDYRRIPRALSKVYYDPLTPENEQEVNKLFDSFASADPSDPPIRNRKIITWGRELVVPESTSKVAKFEFEDLCNQPLSAADYLEITKNFSTIFILNIPKMGLDKKDLARRFITFIDACYESKTKLFVTSEVPVYQVFSDDPNESLPGHHHMNDHMRSVMDDLGLTTDVVGTSSMFTGEEEVFAFARACSRLVQMGSKEWAETAGQT